MQRIYLYCSICTLCYCYFYISNWISNWIDLSPLPLRQTWLILPFWFIIKIAKYKERKKEKIACVVWHTQQTKLVWLVYFDALNLTHRIGHNGQMPTLEAELITCDLFHTSIWFGAVLGVIRLWHWALCCGWAVYIALLETCWQWGGVRRWAELLSRSGQYLDMSWLAKGKDRSMRAKNQGQNMQDKGQENEETRVKWNIF